MKKTEEPQVRVKSTPAFKLKDRKDRNIVGFNLKKQFGFVPEVIIIEKVPRVNNGFIVRAIMPEAAIKAEKEQLSKVVAEIKKKAKK